MISDGISNWDLLSSLDISGVLTANAVDGALTLRTGMASGGGAAAVPISLFAANNVTGGTFDHAIAILGLMQPDTASVAGTYYGIEGRVDYGKTTGSAFGILGLATFNQTTARPNVTVVGVRARTEAGPLGNNGTGLSIALYATALGGSSNIHALFGDGTVVGDNGLILIKGYITAVPGSAQAVLSIDDVTDTFFIDVADAGLLGMTVKLKDTAGVGRFKVINSAGTAVLDIPSSTTGVPTAAGKSIVNRVALTGFTDASANTRQSYRPMVAGADAQMGIRMPWAGKVVGLSILTTTARTAGTSVWTVNKNGAATAVTATLDGTNTISHSTTGGTDTFVAGDILDVRHTDTTYTPAGVIIEATVFVEYDT